MEMETFRKAVAAGVSISIGATVYLVCESKLAGALLFTIGLFVICTFGLNLFTGKIGYVLENRNHPNCFVIWLGNLTGCVAASGLIRLAKPSLFDTASGLVQAKLSLSWYSVLVLGFFCGILMYLAVENYRSNPNDFGKVTGLFLCVSVFILCGFEHSIADMCYCVFGISSWRELPRILLFLVAVSLANSLGSLTVRFLTRDRTENRTK